MKHKILFVTFAAVAAFTVGCDRKDSVSAKMDQVQEKTAAASQDLADKEYTYAQKAEYTAKMQAQLADINRDLDALEVKINNSSDAMKAEAKPKLQVLREQTAELSKRLEDAKNATESTWDTVKAESKKAFANVKDGFNQARQWVSDKIAP